MAYNRYSRVSTDGRVGTPPFVKLNVKDTDLYVTYKRGMSRLDNISYDYYGDPSFDWLILMANPELTDLEFNIPDNSIVRIPFPLDATINEYEKKIDAYETLYGRE
jgi:hypothetical protein